MCRCLESQFVWAGGMTTGVARCCVPHVSSEQLQLLHLVKWLVLPCNSCVLADALHPSVLPSFPSTHSPPQLLHHVLHHHFRVAQNPKTLKTLVSSCMGPNPLPCE